MNMSSNADAPPSTEAEARDNVIADLWKQPPFFNGNKYWQRTQTPPVPPRYLRVHEAEEYTRLSRTTLYDLMRRGLIHYVTFRKPGKTTGTRLVCFQSLQRFLDLRTIRGGEEEEREKEKNGQLPD